MQSGGGQALGGIIGSLSNLFGGGGGDEQQPTVTPPEREPSEPRTPRLSCNPDDVVAGQRVTIGWTCFNSNTSEGIGFETGGPASGEVTVMVGTSTEGSVTYGVRCGNGGERRCSISVTEPVVTLIAQSREVESGERVELSWASTETRACAVYGPNGRLAFGGTSGSVETEPLEQATRFRIACETNAPSPVASEVLVEVEGDDRPPLESEIPDDIFESVPSPNNINGGDSGTGGQSAQSGTQQDDTTEGSGSPLIDAQTGESVQFCDPAEGIWKFTQCLLRQ